MKSQENAVIETLFVFETAHICYVLYIHVQLVLIAERVGSNYQFSLISTNILHSFT